MRFHGLLTASNAKRNKSRNLLDLTAGKHFSAGLIFFPSVCKICGRFLENPEEKIVCRLCLAEMKPNRRAFCSSCGCFFEHVGPSYLCRDCLERKPLYFCHRSCGAYSGRLREVILLFKYRKYRVLEHPLAEFMYSSLHWDKELRRNADVMIPVPLHKKRRRQRGFNQSLVLARTLASRLSIQLEGKVLHRPVHRPPQTSLSAADRGRNIQGVFALKNPEKIKGKIILLLDDVYTTGATLQECSRVLLAAGAKEIRAVTLARTG